MFEMLSTVCLIILVKALISPSLFSEHSLTPRLNYVAVPQGMFATCSCLSVIFTFDASGGPDNLTLSL